jgi:hypothetical protein
MPNWRDYRSPEAKQARSDKASRAALARWDAYHAMLVETEPPWQDPPADMYRLTFENLMTGKTEVMTFHPGNRINNFNIDVNGTPWKTTGFVDALRRIEKSCAKMRRMK